MITYKYPTKEDEVQQIYKLSSMRDIAEWLGGAIMPPILRRNAIDKEIIIAKDGEKVVGFISFHIRKDGFNTIHYQAVHPEYRGLGITKKLTSYLQRPLMAKCKGDNERIQSFYRKLGMTKVKTEIHTKKNGERSEVLTFKMI